MLHCTPLAHHQMFFLNSRVSSRSRRRRPTVTSPASSSTTLETPVDTIRKDLAYAFRMLGRNPGFTAIAILALALGIGANTAIFSVVNAVLLKPLPYPNADQLVKIWGQFEGIGIPTNRNWISAPEFNDIERMNHSFSQVAAIDGDGFNLTGHGQPERLAA